MNNDNKINEEKIFFPTNVQKSYQIIEGLGWYEIQRYILPAIAIAVVICVIPPYNSIIFWIIKILLLLLILTVCIFLIFLKPVPLRKNISLEQWLRMQRDYKKRQKIFFIEKKEKRYGK